LDDAERARVGTIYKQVSAFEAKKIGAALVSRNIARHIEDSFVGKPRGWKPLIYCWRGGSRSGSLAHVLKQIGFGAAQMDGGYKAYRRTVVAELDSLRGRFDFRVVCGPTGSGKSRLLQALQESGAQVLDLEGLAAHRGSVLGNLPDAAQPPQKMFDSQLWWTLQHFNPSRQVYVEAESKKIGLLRVPDALLARMREGGCVRVEVATPLRVVLLKEEYAHFLANPAALKEKLDCLVGLYGHEIIARWNATGRTGSMGRTGAGFAGKALRPRLRQVHIEKLPSLRRHDADCGGRHQPGRFSLDGATHPRTALTGWIEVLTLKRNTFVNQKIQETWLDRTLIMKSTGRMRASCLAGRRV